MKKHLLYALVGFALLPGITSRVNAQAFTEDFNDITLLAGNGWSLQNLSTPVGSTNWFQGNPISAGGPFDSYNGAANAYIGANYNNTGNTGTISNWLMTPNRTLRNGDVITFFTRKVAPDSYADRLEVRMSTNGASTNAGTNATTVGDFTTLLVSINPSLVLGVYPTAWTQYTITISGLSAPMSGRIAFRYFVTNAGLNGTNSDYIGIDNVVYTPYVCPGLTISPSTLPNGTAGTAYSQSLSQTGALGTPTYSVTAGALPPGVTLSSSGVISGTPTATGTFNFTATVGDNSGCSGSQAFSITIVCPTGGATLSSIPALCSNGTPYTLVEGSPAGGTYSGTGVSSGMFDPSVGTQTITYSLTDAYGCPQSTSGTATVNTAPTVTLSSFSAVCSNAGTVTLSGGSPAGGMYSGTNVSGSTFDPSGGTQSIMYMYTDANGCSGMDMQSFPVNTAPTVTLSSFTAVCANSGTVTLTEGSPVGGTYSGTNVSGTTFDPSAGSQSIMYMYTDGNGCSDMATQTYPVNTPPTLTASADTTICAGSSVTLICSGALTYTWLPGNQTGSSITVAPSVNTSHTVIGTDANGCTSIDSIMVTVNALPNVMITGTNLICPGATATLVANGASSFAWQPGGQTTATITDSPASNTTYIVTGTDAAGCSNTATFTVTIDTPPATPSIVVNGSTLTSSVTGNSYQWFLNGTPISGATSQSYTATQTGSYTVEVYTAAGCGSGQSTAVVDPTGMAPVTANDFVSVFPNPTSGLFTVEFTQQVAGDLSVRLLSVDGKVIRESQRSSFSGTYHEEMDLRTAPKGVYLLEINGSEGRTLKKIVVE